MSHPSQGNRPPASGGYIRFVPGVDRYLPTDGYIRIVPTVDNIVSTVFLDCFLDLEAVALSAPTIAEYDPKLIDAVVMRLPEPETKAFIYASGMMVCMGAKCEKDSRLAARKFARIIQKIGFPAQFKDFKIQREPGFGCVSVPIMFGGLAVAYETSDNVSPQVIAPESREQHSVLPRVGCSEVPLDVLLALVEPRLDEDKSMQLAALCMKLAKDEVSMEEFAPLMLNIIPDKIFHITGQLMRHLQGPMFQKNPGHPPCAKSDGPESSLLMHPLRTSRGAGSDDQVTCLECNLILAESIGLSCVIAEVLKVMPCDI